MTTFRMNETGKLRTVALIDEDDRCWYYRQGAGQKARIRRLSKTAWEKWDEWIKRQQVTITLPGKDYRLLLHYLNVGLEALQAHNYEHCVGEAEWTAAFKEENGYRGVIKKVEARASMRRGSDT